MLCFWLWVFVLGPRCPKKQNKVYINSNASFWNDQDWHGGEVNAEQEYGLRIDCVFTDKFRKQLGIDNLSEY